MASLVLLLIVLVVNIVVLSLIGYIGVKFKKLDKLDAIHIRQYFVSMLSTVVMCAFLPIIIAEVLYLAFFFMYEVVIFKKDAFEKQRIYSLRDRESGEFQTVESFRELFFYKYEKNPSGPLHKDYLYSFSHYVNNAGYIFMFYCAKNVVNSGNTVLFAIEYFVAFTALFVVLAKVVYHLALNTPSALFFCRPTLSYIPVAFVGLVFYTLTILIFLNIV